MSAKIEISKEPRYSLSELVRQCDASVPLSAEDREWLDASSMGNEAPQVERVKSDTHGSRL